MFGIGMIGKSEKVLMRNCLIMGFGRSGTSLMAGILNQAGYFSGDNLYPPRDSNLMGFFENDFINGINERILQEYDPVKKNTDPSFPGKTYSPFRPGYGHRWLICLEPGTMVDFCDEPIVRDIREAVKVKGYAYKDPRFNYTLGVWHQRINDDTLYIIMFRRPDITVGSVLTECAHADYLSEFYIDTSLAYRLWHNSYSFLLSILSGVPDNRKIFVNYEQLLTGTVLKTLSKQLGAPLQEAFIHPELSRSTPVGAVPDEVKKIYNDLCLKANYDVGSL